MGQVKKTAVRNAILASAFQLFSRRGYHGATMSEIATGAGVSPANVYVYFKSKLDIVFAIYTPWLRERLEALERDAAQIADPVRRVRRIVKTLWREIPAEHNGFANTVIQAVSAATPKDRYDPALLNWTEAKIAKILGDALLAAGIARPDIAPISHAMVMAFDGFATNVLLNPRAACNDVVVKAVSSLLLGESPVPVKDRRRETSMKSARRRKAKRV